MGGERLKIETVITLMESSNKETIEKLKVAYGNYNLAKKNCEPFIEDLKTGMRSINDLYIKEGKDAPFILSYADLEAGVEAKKDKLKELEAEKASTKVVSVAELTAQFPGLTYNEVMERHAESQKKYDEIDRKVKEADKAYHQAFADKTKVKPEKFDERCNSYEYLKELIDGKRDELNSEFIENERTTNALRVQVYSLDVALQSLERKYGVIAEAEKVFESISEKIGIELIYDDAKTTTKSEEKEQKETKKDEKKPEKEEVVENAETLAENAVENSARHEESATPETHENESMLENPDDIANYLDNQGQQEPEQPYYDAYGNPLDMNYENPLGNYAPNGFDIAEDLNKKIPLRERFKVTNVRWARTKPFIKSVLMMSAVAGLGLGAVTATAVVGAGLGIGAQAIYRLILKNNGGRIPAMEDSKLRENQANATWICAAYHGIKNKLINAIKNRTRKVQNVPMNNTMNQTEQSLNQAVPLTPETLEQLQQLDMYDVNVDEAGRTR